MIVHRNEMRDTLARVLPVDWPGSPGQPSAVLEGKLEAEGGDA